MMRVLFLDIDGVLNSEGWNAEHQSEIVQGILIDRAAVRLLAQLVHETDARLILHSGWRMWFDAELRPLRKEAEILVSLFAEAGLSLAGITPDLTTEEIRRSKRFSLVKDDEIMAWLASHSHVEAWVVLDDLELPGEQIRLHQVQTDPAVGLTLQDVKKAEQLLVR